MAFLSFILSKSTASTLIASLKKANQKSKMIQAPCNFNAVKFPFEIEHNNVLIRSDLNKLRSLLSMGKVTDKEKRQLYQIGEIQFVIPTKVLENCMKKTMAYRVSLEHQRMEIDHHTDEWIPEPMYVDVETQGSKTESLEALFEPLVYKSSDGNVFKLTEPNLDKVVGPILEIQGMKMHISQGFDSTFEFSNLLAECANVQKGHVTLDMFLGLGYSSKHAIKLGAKKVVSFEKYEEVVQLVKRNPFSADLNATQMHLYEHRVDIEQSKEIFGALNELKCKYDSVIIDPPKKSVMLHVYSTQFLEKLAPFVKRGATVAAYVPKIGTTPQFQSILSSIQQVFESTKQFQMIGKDETSDFIYMFEKT